MYAGLTTPGAEQSAFCIRTCRSARYTLQHPIFTPNTCCLQEEARKLATFTDYRMVSVVGGQPIEEQGFKLRKGCEIIIATPGRLLDCLEKAYAVLNQCNYVVLDEADRMIDLGFEPQARCPSPACLPACHVGSLLALLHRQTPCARSSRCQAMSMRQVKSVHKPSETRAAPVAQVISVLDAMPSTNLKPEDEAIELDQNRVYRTTYMFSATMPSAVERLARKYLRRPVVVNIGSAGRATDNVTQRVVVVKARPPPAGHMQLALGSPAELT